MKDLPPDVAELLGAERVRQELSEAELAESWRSLSLRLSASGGGGSAGDAPGGTGAAVRGGALWKAAAIAVLAFVAGVVTGRSWPAPEPPPIVPSAPVPASVAPAPEPPPSGVRPEELPPIPLVSRRAPPPPSAPVASRVIPAPAASSSNLGDERALVEGARTALFRGRAGDALALVTKHQEQFPAGELSEDRDFLRVLALRDLGRSAERQRAARVFLQRYPRSALRETVEPLANE